MRILVCLFLLCSSTVAAPTIVIDADGNYYVGDGGGELVRVLPENVWRFPGAPDGPEEPEEPEDPNISDRAKEIAVLSERVDDVEGAAAFAAVVKTIGDALDPGEEIDDSSWTLMMNTVLAGATDAKRDAWQTWVAAVNTLSDGARDASFFRDVYDGLDAAYDLDDELINALIARAQGSATAAQESFLAEAGWDVDMILRIVTAIIEILRLIGVL